jgi:hypothetical protein
MSDEHRQSDIQRHWFKELFAVQRSIKYHTRRQAFYDGWNNIANAVSILFGAGTVAALAHKLPLADVLSVLFPIVITILATLNLVWGASRRARLHNDLHRRFVDLERKMISATAIDEQSCRSARGERLAIEADEPPIMFVVSVLCHNEVARANGVGDYFEVPLWHKWLGHFWAFPNAKFAPINPSTSVPGNP